MVRVSPVLARIPVIKFRKGGLNSGATAAQGSAPPPSAAKGQTAAPAAQMSTSSIPDLDLPQRYRRAPLSEEEIAHINGGGIV